MENQAVDRIVSTGLTRFIEYHLTWFFTASTWADTSGYDGETDHLEHDRGAAFGGAEEEDRAREYDTWPECHKS